MAQVPVEAGGGGGGSLHFSKLGLFVQDVAMPKPGHTHTHTELLGDCSPLSVLVSAAALGCGEVLGCFDCFVYFKW